MAMSLVMNLYNKFLIFFRPHLANLLFIASSIVFILLFFSACKQSQVTDQINISSYNELFSTKHTNGFYGQFARCNFIYKNNFSVINPRSYSCDSSKFLDNYFGILSVNSLGILESSTNILAKVLQSTPKNPSIALLIKQRTKTFLNNLMANHDHPIHPAAFFATIKDYETSTNIHQWGKNHFNCSTPGMCTKKCIDKQDCDNWCSRNYNLYGGINQCLDKCQSDHLQLCDDRCYGLFQVDVEIENFYQPEKNNNKFVLWDQENIHWDLQQVCGKNGLDILGLQGGPDYCALLFWFLIGENGRKCEGFALEMDIYNVIDNNGTITTKIANPCTDAGYQWTKANLEIGHIAYQQHHSIDSPWVKKYYGFFDDDNRFIQGYEHCAIEDFIPSGIDTNNPFLSDSFKPFIRKAVLDFGCKVGVIPKWAPSFYCQI